MSDCADAARPSHDEHLHEVAAILAAGVLRLQQRAALPTKKDPKKPVKQPPNGLEVSAETRLSVRVG